MQAVPTYAGYDLPTLQQRTDAVHAQMQRLMQTWTDLVEAREELDAIPVAETDVSKLFNSLPPYRWSSPALQVLECELDLSTLSRPTLRSVLVEGANAVRAQYAHMWKEFAALVTAALPLLQPPTQPAPSMPAAPPPNQNWTYSTAAEPPHVLDQGKGFLPPVTSGQLQQQRVGTQGMVTP